MISVYLIGSLKNPEVPKVAQAIRALGFEVFDDWYAVGPEADDYWRDYEKAKGHNFAQALAGYSARHIFEFDKHHIDRCSIGILLMPSGKSAHLELGYMAGQDKTTIYCYDQEPERYDIMVQFANHVCCGVPALLDLMKQLAPSTERLTKA